MTQRPMSDPQILAALHAGSFRTAAEVLRACPRESLDSRAPHCPRSVRELALDLIYHERLIRDVVQGEIAVAAAPAPVGADDILRSYEEAHRKTHTALSRIAEQEWDEIVRGPAELELWEPVSRRQLLWIALEDLVDQVRHMAAHVAEPGGSRSQVATS